MRKTYYGEQGWRSGESARLPPMWPGFKSRRRHHMWVEFVVGSLLCSERFFSGYSGFPLFSKTSISKFQFDQELGRRRTDVLPPNHYYLFIYLLFIHLWVTCTFQALRYHLTTLTHFLTRDIRNAGLPRCCYQLQHLTFSYLLVHTSLISDPIVQKSDGSVP